MYAAVVVYCLMSVCVLHLSVCLLLFVWVSPCLFVGWLRYVYNVVCCVVFGGLLHRSVFFVVCLVFPVSMCLLALCQLLCLLVLLLCCALAFAIAFCFPVFVCWLVNVMPVVLFFCVAFCLIVAFRSDVFYCC